LGGFQRNAEPLGASGITRLVEEDAGDAVREKLPFATSLENR
jgi:hypothetical protein